VLLFHILLGKTSPSGAVVSNSIVWLLSAWLVRIILQPHIPKPEQFIYFKFGYKITSSRVIIAEVCRSALALRRCKIGGKAHFVKL
jgi:hypothetical protein